MKVNSTLFEVDWEALIWGCLMSFREIMLYLDHHDLGEVQRASEFAAQLSSLVKAQICQLTIESQIPELAIDLLQSTSFARRVIINLQPSEHRTYFRL